MQTISQILAQELNCKQEYIENVIALLDEGNTIPFIARYRKEQHGAMDDTALRTLETRLQYLRNLAQRREEVKSSIEAQEKLTDELAKAIDEAKTLAEVEDLYRPYKPKRRTRATIAKEKGLEPLADAIFAQTLKMDAPEMLAQAYIDPEKGVETIEDALTGASDILAERISDDAEVRKSLRALMNRRGTAQSAAAKDEEDEKTAVYRQYFEFSQPISRLQSHQVLALNRGEREGALKVSLAVDRNEALQCIRRGVVRPGSPAMEFMKSVCDDSYDRLLEPSMERELRTALTDMANEQAIHNFALNLRPLLMQPPVKGAVTMGLDPGYSHGCKVAVVDETGKVLDTTVVYPTFGEKQKQDAIAKLSQLIKKDNVRHLAIGNGTASRETEAMAVEMIHKLGGGVSYMIVNEAGASVYSASKLAAEEFPQYDVNLRSAVSIARRLQDPLAELVIVPEHRLARKKCHGLGEGLQAEFCFRFCKVAATDPACQLAAEAVAEQAHANAPGRCQHHQYRPDGWALHQQYQHQQDTQNRQTGGEHLQSPSWFLFHQIICLLAGLLLHSRARSIRPPSEWGGSWGCAWYGDRYSCSAPRAHGS